MSDNAKIQLITPAFAKRLLENNNDVNRTIRWSTVDAYARDMAAGRWQVNGEAITFDRDDQIISGQHRLHACVKANVPFQTFVIRGLDPRVRVTTDRPCLRTPGDMLSTVYGVTDHHSIAAILRIIDGYETNRLVAGGKVSSAEIEDAFMRHPSVFEATRKARYSGGALRCAPIHFMVYAAFILAPERHADLVEKLATGSNMNHGHPILMLRNLLLKGNAKINGGNQRNSYVMTVAIKALNAYLAGVPIHHLKKHPEESVPSVSGWPIGTKLDLRTEKGRLRALTMAG